MRDAVHVERQDQRKARWSRYPGNSTGFDHRPSQLESPITRRKFEQATPAIAACPIVAKLGTAINSLARMGTARARAHDGGRPETAPGAAGAAACARTVNLLEPTDRGNCNGQSMHPCASIGRRETPSTEACQRARRYAMATFRRAPRCNRSKRLVNSLSRYYNRAYVKQTFPPFPFVLRRGHRAFMRTRRAPLIGV
jgi:hypothetical protein